MTTPTLTDVVVSLSPNHPAFYYEGNTITGWDVSEVETGIPQPTQAEIDAEFIRLQAVYDGNAYQRTRAAAYKEIKEQLDQLYHDMTAGKLDATGEWHKAIKAVKDATPKP